MAWSSPYATPFEYQEYQVRWYDKQIAAAQRRKQQTLESWGRRPYKVYFAVANAVSGYRKFTVRSFKSEKEAMRGAAKARVSGADTVYVRKWTGAVWVSVL